MVEKKAWKVNGFLGFLIEALLLGGGIFAIVREATVPAVVLLLLFLFMLTSLSVVFPNQAKVVTFFGSYVGSIRESGMWLTIPFSGRRKISLRVRNFNSIKLKVNDINGNPIEIAAVVVFRVIDSAKALFDVDNYNKFVEIQSETALRHVASKYPYDDLNGDELSLRGNSDEVSAELTKELLVRLAVSGVEVIEARLTHLAYSTEIASAMLQRQQATAILAARQKIVEGAVGMVQMAISQLQSEGIVELDDERKAAMINNLMVAIVSDRAAQPVINSSSLY
ncbi:SPFH domain-containing protein [Gorillibacterium massiliense]|uniref:SPFH domain-containing protein n=1 Tax=Gorillibacterium massiliense TaxID=1280390 RepID=UPI0004B5B63E|nr:SPFH domain-containing protein [Gorillibacterium massiliense]